MTYRPRPQDGQAWKEACDALTDDYRPTMYEIVRQVAQKHGVSTKTLRDMYPRSTFLARARWEAWTLLREEGRSTCEIGRYFSDRDHSTILYGLKKFRSLSQ